jgi:hypothetical protein
MPKFRYFSANIFIYKFDPGLTGLLMYIHDSRTIVYEERRFPVPYDVFQPSRGCPAHAVDRALAQDAEAHVTFLADVRVPQPRQALDLGSIL